jgi:hypothetical protein
LHVQSVVQVSRAALPPQINDRVSQPSRFTCNAPHRS